MYIAFDCFENISTSDFTVTDRGKSTFSVNTSPTCMFSKDIPYRLHYAVVVCNTLFENTKTTLEPNLDWCITDETDSKFGNNLKWILISLYF